MKHASREKQAATVWSRLSHPLAKTIFQPDHLRHDVARFIALEQENRFANRLATALKKFESTQVVNAQFRTFENFGTIPIMVKSIQPARAWQLFAKLFEINSDVINFHVQIRLKVEHSILCGDYAAASSHLEEAHRLSGDSLWYLKQKCLVLAGTGASVADFIASVKTRMRDSLFKHMASIIQLFSDTEGNAHIHWKNVVVGFTEELKEAGIDGPAGLMSVILTPDPLLKSNYEDIDVRYFQILPVVDLYDAVIRVLTYAVIDPNQAEIGPENIESYLQGLQEFIDDSVLARLRNPPYAFGQSPDQLMIGSIVEDYECGRYGDVIAKFRDDAALLKNPIHYCLITGKAAAHLRTAPVLPKSELGQFANDIYSIHSLNQNSVVASDRLISRIVKLHGFHTGFHMQALACMSLPHTYSPETIGITARGALIYDPNASPLIYALAKGMPAAAIPEASRGTLGDIPGYRLQRRQIYKLWDNREEVSSVFRAFKDLSRMDGLKKDYLELFTAYCIFVRNFEALISELAAELVSDKHAHICLPLEEIVDAIEENRFNSLEAVIISHIHLRHKSDKKDYILHECLEEYLARNCVERPSELLAELQELTALERYFFVEVCVPENIDYLSCFSATIELRAERVAILDRLLELNCITADSRMSEVEDLVGHTVIDAIATKLNGPKIYVDTATISKRLAEEASALLTLYQATGDANETQEDRFTIITELEEIEGEATAYASGSKNSVLIKINNLFQNALLFDEKNGLDKNLSTEIRHGFFANLIRSRPEARSLLMELGSDNTGLPNHYWRDRHSFLNEHATHAVEMVLLNFTNQFNNQIAIAEERMKIRTNPQTRIGLSFEVLKEDFERMRSAIDSIKTPEELTAFLIEEFWKRTEEQLAKLREYLNVKFRNEMEVIFENVKADLNSIGNIALMELTSAIEITGAEIKEDISTVADWFARTEFSDFGDRDIESALRIAVTSFQKIRPAIGEIQYHVRENFEQKLVPGYALKAFILAVINLLDNSVRHSGLGRGTEIIATFGITEGRFFVDISNNVSADRINHLTTALFSELNGRMRSSASGPLLRSEGGSGLCKAYHHLTNSLVSSDLVVFLENSKFNARIWL